MRFLRSRRSFVGAIALVALAAVTLFVVMPGALASPSASRGGTQSAPYTAVPPAANPSTVIPIDEPTGGQSNDCAFFYDPTNSNNATTGQKPTWQFRIANPKKGTFTSVDPQTGASFQVTVDSSDKWTWFSAANAAVVDVGIKGGTDETWYNYDKASTLFGGPVGPGYVFTDGHGGTFPSGGLHAPAQDTSVNPAVLYSVSNITFCYNTGSVSGTVYDDLNQNGSYNTAGDTPLAGWTIRLYQGTTLVATTTSGASGTYTINTAFDGTSNYRVCEAPNPSTPFPAGTNAWAQTEPSGTTATCTGAGELAKGWMLTKPSPVQNISGTNFGNVGAIKCTTGPFGIPGYQVGTCKPSQTYVFDSGTLPDGTPFVSYWVGDPSQTAVPTVEKLIFADPIAGGQPAYTKILFEDGAGFPVDTADLAPMPYCKIDPRTSEFGLGQAASGDVLPSDSVKSCLISVRTYVDAAGKGWLEAYDYSLTDNVRGAG